PPSTPATPATPPPPAPAVLPGFEIYDFTSDWDQNAMGIQAGRVLRGHARRMKKFDMLVDIDREPILQDAPAPADYPDNLTAWVAHARAHFEVRWIAGGKLTGWDPKKKSFVMDVSVVDIGVKAADGAWPAPKVIFAKRFDVAADVDIPPLMDAVLTAVAGAHLTLGQPTYPKVISAGPNLVQNGTFEALDDHGFAQHWVDASMKKGMVKTVIRPVDPAPAGQVNTLPPPDPAQHCMELAPDADMATSYGLICYSDEIPVTPATAYQLSMNIRAKGVGVIVWVKGYSMVDGRLQNTYKHQKRYYPDHPGRWNAWQSEPFLPRHPQYPITQMKVMLYAYGAGAGQAWFDDVELRAVKIDGPLPKADFEIPDRQHSGWKLSDGDDRK
ncbi:MAG: hypothetical protein ACREJ2_10170, partial [Planctomycetota bacterium]